MIDIIFILMNSNNFLYHTDRDAVEKRLSILQDQGYVYSNTVNGNNST